MAPAIGALLRRMMFARYLLASVAALAGDFLFFLALDRIGASPVAAAAGGYGAGLLLHWMLSVHFVFTPADPVSHAQRAGFVLSALVGLGVTMASVAGLTAAGLAPALARALAVPVSFLAVYAIRKHAVFARC